MVSTPVLLEVLFLNLLVNCGYLVLSLGGPSYL